MKQSDKKPVRFYSQKDIEKLTQRMDEDMKEMLNSSEPVQPYEFSEQYEEKLKASLIERLGKEKAEEVLRRRKMACENQVSMSDEVKRRLAAVPENDAENLKVRKSKEVHPLKTCEKSKKIKKSSGQSRKKKISHFPISKFTKIAAAVFVILTASLIFGKNEAQASWWENMQFIVKSYKEYSKIEAYEDVYSEDTEYPSTIEKKYVPTKVAEGCEEVARDEVSKQMRIIFSNAKGATYIYTQQTQDMGQHINTEDAKYEIIETVHGPVYFCQNMGENQIYWEHGGYLFSMVGNINKEKMVNIINSIQLEKGEN